MCSSVYSPLSLQRQAVYVSCSKGQGPADYGHAAVLADVQEAQTCKGFVKAGRFMTPACFSVRSLRTMPKPWFVHPTACTCTDQIYV